MRESNRWNGGTHGLVVWIIGLAMSVSAGCVTAATAQAVQDRAGDEASEPFVDPATLDPRIPTPQSVFGHAVGQAAVRYDALVRYLHALADASDLVTLTPYAESHEGRTLYYLTISSADNLARLDEIKVDGAKLADPRTLRGPAEAQRIVEQLPAIAWLAYSIHGDELSSTGAAIQIAYQLVAGTDAATNALRDKLVIHIDPLQNPDGRERYLGQLQTLVGKVANPDYQAMQHSGLWAAGRGNHYLFDLNRDWLMQVHPETRGRAAAILAWNPHLVVDSHEMGSLDTYLFDPPRQPFNVNLAQKNLVWRRRFSSDQAAAFNRHGWSYYTKEWYEEWYPGYTNAWANLLGAVGLLYEQAGVNGAAIKQASGQTLTYREAVHHHVVSSLANLTSLAANRRAILADYLQDRQWAVSGDAPFNETFLLPPSADRSKRARFAEMLRGQGIEFTIADAPAEATDVVDIWGEHIDTKTAPAGTLVVSSAQPHRRLLHAILGFDPHMADAFLTEERKELENRRSSRVYDITGWNLPMAYGLEAYWAKRIVSVPAPQGDPEPGGHSTFNEEASYGHLIDGRDSDVYRALVVLLDHECKPRIASKPFMLDGQRYVPGTVLLRKHENPQRLPQVLRGVADELTLNIRSVDTALSEAGPDLGGQRFHLLHPMRVAIASQWPVASTSFGSTWFLLDHRLGLRASPINVQSMNSIDLRKYNVLVLPNVWRPQMLHGVLDERVLPKIKHWVEAGGTLIAVGGAAAFLADDDSSLSSVRLKRDVLDELAMYQEAIDREIDARDISVDPDLVWGDRIPTADEAKPADDEREEQAVSKPKSGVDVEALKRADEWQRLFSPRGSILASSINPDHWLTFGLGDKLPVLVAGSYAYMSKHPVATPVRLVDEADLRLSGLFWPEARQRWANTAYATVERVGNGQVILFASDPFFRGYFEGSGRLLLNAIVLGPGMGTSQPIPW